MTVHQETLAAGETPQPVSLETLAVVEQVLAQALGALKARLGTPPSPTAGLVEYASWLRGRDA